MGPYQPVIGREHGERVLSMSCLLERIGALTDGVVEFVEILELIGEVLSHRLLVYTLECVQLVRDVWRKVGIGAGGPS